MAKNQNKFENTLKLLDKCLMLETDSRGNLGFAKTVSFTLTAYHNSPDTAFLMVNFAYNLLDSAVRSVSSDRAHRNRVFVEGQLSRSKEVLDSLQKAMRQFQVQNKAYDIPEQLKLSIRAYSDLKAMLLESELRMQAIHNEFSGETPELVSLQKETRAAQEKLDQIEKHQSPDVMPGLESSTKLMPEYANLMRDLEIQDQLIVFISRELEQAKLKESKNISGLVVVDPAFIPEYKARPKRVKIEAVIVGLYMLFVFCFIAIQQLHRSALKDNEAVKAIWDAMRSKHKK
jgi:capsule polysaccharide export protein KpsE/RkpR